MPVAATNRRANVRGLVAARRASTSTVSGSSRCSTAQSRVVRNGSSHLRELGHGCLDELGLATVAVRRHDHAPGDGVGDVGAVVVAHDVEAQVDGGGGAGRGHHVAVDDVEDVRLHADRREPLGEQVGVHPVGGGPAAVEQAGVGEQERAAAEAEDPGAAVVRRPGARPRARRSARRRGLHIGMTTVPARSTSARGGTACRWSGRATSWPGSGGSTAAHTSSWYQGSTSSLRSRPNTSQATLSSNGLTPWVTIAATMWGAASQRCSGHVGSMAAIMRT